MPFTLPTLAELRAMNRDNVTATLRSGPMIPNSVLRVMSDANAGLAFLVLLYLNWLSEQFLPDTCEDQWLDRQAAIWLPNNGRKQASYASGSAGLTGIFGSVFPSGSELSVAAGSGQGALLFQTTQAVTLGAGTTTVPIVALVAGSASNLAPNTSLNVTTAIAGINGTAAVISLTGGTDEETDDELRPRVLQRIQEPPMGGDANDYEAWALEVPGVTRAWCSPCEQGVGTVTLRFMMDDLRATPGAPMTDGFPLPADCATVLAYLNTKRPVTVKDIFVEAPIPFPINFTLANVDPDETSTFAAIATSVAAMLSAKAKPASSLNGVQVPAQTIFQAWVSEAISAAAGVISFDLTMSDQVMPNNGSMAVMGSITRG